MSINNSDEIILSDPWQIYFLQDGSVLPHDSISNVTEQVAGLTVNEKNASAQPKSAWGKHEELTGEILNEAAQRASAETYRNICVCHPTQNHKPSQDAPGIRPDYILAWNYNGVRRNTVVIDAKDYHNKLPRAEYDKICDNMRDTKASRGILVLGPDASIGDKLLADIKKDNKVDIVQLKDRDNAVRDMAQHIGKLIDKNFVLNDEHWKTYKSFVDSTEFSKERRPDPYGKNGTYTCNSTYHQFNHPRTQDGTIDERYKANEDRNKDGGPDMRMVHNKNQQAIEQHLNEDGSEDMRNKEHREGLVDETGHRLNVDETPDMRCNENKVDPPLNPASDGDNDQTTENTDMRQTENRESMVDTEGHHLNIDGSPDMRHTENQEDSNTLASDERQLDTNQTLQEQPNENTEAIPTKDDGTADMRFTESKEAVASGEISRDEVLSGGSESSTGGMGEASSGMMDGAGGGDSGPLKADGTPDMRFSANQ